MDLMQEASNVLEQLIGEVRGKFAHSQHQQGVLDSLKAFTAAVDWKVILLICYTWSLVVHRFVVFKSHRLCIGALADSSLNSANIPVLLYPSLPQKYLLSDERFCASK